MPRRGIGVIRARRTRPGTCRPTNGSAPWRNGCSRPYVREARAKTARQSFALANQHLRWELNDPARRLDDQPAAAGLREGLVPAPASYASGSTPDGRHMLATIDELPEHEREVFDLVRRQPITHDFFVVSSRDPHHGLAG